MNRTSLSRNRVYRLLAGAVALALPSIVLAQGQIDTGRSNDASNQVGSGGRNATQLNSSYYNNAQIINNGNRIVTGNVSQGREFRGTINYTDPSAFRGTAVGLAGENFTKNSTGIPHSVEPVPNTSVPFYGNTQTAAPPPGFHLNATRTGFVPTPTAPGERPLQDQRLGIIDLNQPIAPLPTPGEMLLRGSLNPQQAAQQAGILTGSALYGVREWNPQDPADRVFLENLINRQNGAFNRTQSDPRDVQRMRTEIERALEGDQQQQQPNQGDKTTSPNKSQDGGFTLNPIGRTFETPNDPALNNKPINDNLQARPLGSGVNTEQGMQFKILGAARRTSTQYTEMSKRLAQFNAEHPQTDADRAREFNAQFKAKQDADKATANAKEKTRPGAGDDLTPRTKPAGNDATTAKPTAKKPEPVKIKSFAQGVVGEGLGNVLKKAEALMKEGKYTSALDQYDTAEAVTPNNPLIWLGRANAELGAGFFKRAAAHLQQAFGTDQALLMGQYDLSAMLGEERLTKLVQELKEIANKDNSDPMAVFLLGYIAYNTGHEPQAMAYLDLAEKRGGPQAPFFKMLRDHWGAPTEGAKPGADNTPKPELNK
jgi:tetratricopeptide (TPR) repeat protein